MANSPQYENIHRMVAEAVAKGGIRPSSGFDINALMPTGMPTGQAIAPTPPKQEQGWSLGQGLIDLVSSGTYVTAGMGQKWGENIAAIERGEIGGALDLFNPISNALAAGGGIQNRRTWSENLTDWGVDEGTAAAAGLALDIALDPLWLIPGGAIATGIKATAKGVGAASATTKAGIKLTPEAYKSAQGVVKGLEKGQLGPAKTTRPYVSQSITTGKEGLRISEPIQQFYPMGQQAKFIENLIQGVRQTNVDDYAKWSTDRAWNKVQKRAFKEGDWGITKKEAQAFFKGESIIPAIVKGTKHIADESGTSAEKAANEIADTINIKDNETALPEAKNDISAPAEIIEEANDLPSINQMARDGVQPGKTAYLKSREIPEVEFDYKKISASEKAPQIAKAYNDLVNAPNDPDVIRAYQKLAEEAQDQYDYMTNELGITVKFVDYDPYHVGGQVNSKAMMQDIVENKTLEVKKSVLDADPATGRIHPLLTNEQNDIFRAVHDFFGHAASGRGFRQDGEEAAWVSHSVMFSPEARKAMTTETRGQNSWVNTYGTNPDGTFKKFAPQKVGFLPDEFIALPTEAAAVERLVGNTNSLIGRTVAALQMFADEIVSALGMAYSPVAGAKLYSAAEIKQIKAALDKLNDATNYSPKSGEVGSVIKQLETLRNLIERPNAKASRRALAKDQGIYGLLEIAQDALDVTEIEKQGAVKRGVAMFRQLLDEPIDATDLLESTLAAEGRFINEPAPFKPTTWAPAKETYGKPGFSQAKLERLFPGDELLSKPGDLEIAFGKKEAKPGSLAAKRLATRQRNIWESFRARNSDLLEDVQKRERNDWIAANSVANSQVFVGLADGTRVGQGLLPSAIPPGALFVHNGKPTTTLGAILEGLGKVATRRGSELGGLPSTQIVGETVRGGKRQILEDLPAGREARVVEAGTLTNKELIDEIIANPKAKVSELSPARKELRKKIKARGRDIDTSVYPEELQYWILTKVDGLLNRVKTTGAKDARLADNLTDPMAVEGLASRIMAEIPAIKSMSDARMLVQLGPDAVAELRKRPLRRYFIDERAQLQATKEISRGTDTTGGWLRRDPETGVPIDAEGKAVPERQAERGVFDQTGKKIADLPAREKGLETGDWRLLTTEGKNFTGRSGQKYASQAAGGSQQLASLEVARSAIGSISDAITSGSFQASAEGAKLLSDVLTSLGVKVAEGATPKQVLKQFKEQAPAKFDDVIRQIEGAAKDESVAMQLRTVFPIAIKENISVMEAIARIDVGELQTRSFNWTTEALNMVDESCAAATKQPNIFLQITRGLNQ